MNRYDCKVVCSGSRSCIGLTVHILLRDILGSDERWQLPHVASEHTLVNGIRALRLAVVLVWIGSDDLMIVAVTQDLVGFVGFDGPGGRRFLVRLQQIQTRLALFAHRADLLSRHTDTDERYRSAARTTWTRSGDSTETDWNETHTGATRRTVNKRHSLTPYELKPSAIFRSCSRENHSLCGIETGGGLARTGEARPQCKETIARKDHLARVSERFCFSDRNKLSVEYTKCYWFETT